MAEIEEIKRPESVIMLITSQITRIVGTVHVLLSLRTIYGYIRPRKEAEKKQRNTSSTSYLTIPPPPEEVTTCSCLATVSKWPLFSSFFFDFLN